MVFRWPIAHEMACRLEEIGEEVALLALLDTKSNYEKDQLEGLTMEQSIDKLAKDYGVDPGETNNSRLEFVRKLLVNQDLIPDETPLDWVHRAFKQLAATPNLTRNHKTRVCNAQILFFEAALENRAMQEQYYTWENHSKNLVHKFSINSLHNTMMEKATIKTIANHVIKFIERLN